MRDIKFNLSSCSRHQLTREKCERKRNNCSSALGTRLQNNVKNTIKKLRYITMRNWFFSIAIFLEIESKRKKIARLTRRRF
jgi:hypothetical protein